MLKKLQNFVKTDETIVADDGSAGFENIIVICYLTGMFWTSDGTALAHTFILSYIQNIKKSDAFVNIGWMSVVMLLISSFLNSNYTISNNYLAIINHFARSLKLGFLPYISIPTL